MTTYLEAAYLNLDIIRSELKCRTRALREFQDGTPYSRGGTYPKMIASLKYDIAISVMRLHKLMFGLRITKFAPRDIHVSRRVVIRVAD